MYWCVPVFLVHRSINRVPSFKLTKVSRKGIHSYDQLAVNLIVRWAVFRSSMNSFSSSSPWLQMINISSMYHYHTEGLAVVGRERSNFSNLDINGFAQKIHVHVLVTHEREL